jgi:hypothetical protein
MKNLSPKEYYANYNGKPLNLMDVIQKQVNRESWAMTPDRPLPAPKPFTPTAKLDKRTIGAFVWALLP